MREIHINFLLSHKGRGARSFWPFDPRHDLTQKRVHRPAVSTHLKAQIYTSIPPKIETNLSHAHLPYCWRSRPFSHLFEIARDAQIYTHISQGPENNISEIWSSSPYSKNIIINGQFFGQSLSEVLQGAGGSECGGKNIFEIGRSYHAETWQPFSRA